MLNRHTKFEISKITCYGYINGNAKRRHRGIVGWLGVTQCHLQCCHTIAHIMTYNWHYKFAFARSSISQTRGNSLKLNKRHLASTRDAALFHNRIISLWNALPDYIVTARSVCCFKRYLLNYANNVGNDFFTSTYY